MKNVSFQGTGAMLSANLYGDESTLQAPRPGIVVVGSWLTVKEQMPALYATHLAAAGYTALTFDFRGFGASAGEPREVESGRAKAQDILDAAAFLATRPEVDPQRIGVLAICASAHYTAMALQGTASFGRALIGSVAMIAPWLHDGALVEQLYGGKPAVQERLQQARVARARYVTTSEVEYIPAASNSDKGAAMYMPGNALDYYLDPRRGAVPTWGARFATMAWTEWLTMNSPSLAAQFDVPLRVITSAKSATPEGTKRFLANLTGAHDVIWGPDDALSQFDFYDQPTTVRFAVDKAIEHFRSTLA